MSDLHSAAPKSPITEYVSTTNACKLCAPLGACVAFRGIEGAVPLIHGSQGCSTYIRRYLISHYNEPIDIASSNFVEESAIFGGESNLKLSLQNVIAKYKPALIGVATSCLAETVGDDVAMILKEYKAKATGDERPEIVSVSTPSYAGTHMDGFHRAITAVASSLAKGGVKNGAVNVLPGFVSPADIRHLKEILADFGLDYTLLPDYSETLDGPVAAQHIAIPPGGTQLADIRNMGRAKVSLQFGLTLGPSQSVAAALRERFRIPCYRLALPIGVSQTDRMFRVMEHLSGMPTPRSHRLERGRLIDSYVDGHKYVFGKRVILYGEEDLVVSLAAFLSEIGAVPVLCASGGESGRLAASIRKVVPDLPADTRIVQGVDFYEIAEEAERLSPDLLIGNSKGYGIARQLNVRLIRVGFPIHDRIGGQRILHIGYRGTQQLFDSIVNAIIQRKQDESTVGYSYM